jgi:hypothetical protein
MSYFYQLTTWLTSQSIAYTYNSAYMYKHGRNAPETGIIIPLGGDFDLDLQTDPEACGDAIVETALKYKHNVVYTEFYHNDDVIRWYEFGKLLEYITHMLTCFRVPYQVMCTGRMVEKVRVTPQHVAMYTHEFVAIRLSDGTRFTLKYSVY